MHVVTTRIKWNQLIYAAPTPQAATLPLTELETSIAFAHVLHWEKSRSEVLLQLLEHRLRSQACAQGVLGEEALLVVGIR